MITDKPEFLKRYNNKNLREVWEEKCQRLEQTDRLIKYRILRFYKRNHDPKFCPEPILNYEFLLGYVFTFVGLI